MLERIIDHLTRDAKRHPNGIVSVPFSFHGLKGLAMFSSGDVSHHKWIDKRRFLNGRSRSPSKSPTKLSFTSQSWIQSELINISIEECKTLIDTEWEKIKSRSKKTRYKNISYQSMMQEKAEKEAEELKRI